MSSKHKFAKHNRVMFLVSVGFQVLYQPPFGDFDLDLKSRTIMVHALGPYGPWYNLKEFSKSNMLCPMSIFDICSWSSVLFKYGPRAYLT